MSASGTISNLQSALQCAGKCDCCDKLQAQINSINARLANIDEGRIIAKAVARSEASIVPQIPGIASGVATAIASGLIAPLRPQIQSAVNKATEAFGLAEKGFSTASDAKIAAALAEAKATVAQGTAVTADGKAVSAGSKAAQASTEALKASSEVSGLRGIVNGFGSKLNSLGSAIAKVESAVGDALVKAAQAIGISQQALSATARLAGRILEIFQIIGTIFTLIEQLETLRILGDRIDAVENGLVRLGADVSGILGKLLGLQNRIARNESSISEVRGIAIDARGIGEAAKLQAGAAQVTATRAENFAQIANSNAKTAQTTADGAVRNAATANENATTAYTKATQAQSIAEQAKNIGGQALEKAGVALTTALTALALYQGIKSLRGLQGIPGIPGRQGERGLQGIQGVPGRDGVTAVVTLPGTPGPRGQTGRQGVPGIPGRNGRDVNPAEAANLRNLIIQQHAQTRANSTVQHGQTRVTILTPIMAALAPVLALLKQIYDIVSKAASAAQLALLNIINNKLGNQVVGGVSGFIEQIAKNTYIDKALGILTFAATVHNGLMLSNNLGVTFLAIIDQVTGLVMPKNIDGNPIVLSEIIGKTTQALIVDAVGQENYTQLSEQWALANRIYQSTANVFNQVVSLGGLLASGIEIVGGNVGKIGNGLRKGGVLLENAYQWMNPTPNLKGKFFTFANNAQESLNTVQAVVAVPVSIKESINSIGSSNADLQREIAQIDPKDQYGNPIKDKEGKVIHYKDGLPQPEPTVVKEKSEQAKADSTNFIELVLEDIFDGGD
ncbi:MAG: hypothetical protein V7K26_03660 [Nostoc sp.]|uniref:hypothetical protein n=1 Tax=Nostoc sp. TaxID=1180 RepID=UPI002FF0A829